MTLYYNMSADCHYADCNYAECFDTVIPFYPSLTFLIYGEGAPLLPINMVRFEFSSLGMKRSKFALNF